MVVLTNKFNYKLIASINDNSKSMLEIRGVQDAQKVC